jgi:peptide-methionine (R)-S-oxide reductase
MPKGPGRTFPVSKTADEWRSELTHEQFHVLREHGTERPGTSPLDGEKRQGVYFCAGCGAPLFDSAAKYDSGCGWPSFTEPRRDAIGTSIDASHSMVRTEVHCAGCGGHLGHVFPDGPGPAGQRFCMNGAALDFTPEDGDS